jgi:putative flippase GtrA
MNAVLAPVPVAPPAALRDVVGRFAASQAASVVATAVDVAVGVAAVSLGGLSAGFATLLGASVGAVLLFALARWAVFGASAAPLARQAGAFALVAGSSIVLNTVVVAGLLALAPLPFAAARGCAAVGVAALHNFPLHQWVVFAR